ncbi:hypothetical protein MNB_SV-13-839 [hydrothermal vent metagenome]|uniref:Uncharacterized protein n=1 Tax=hydrothermal vent metagenome TaxID=652676 RepID=A0A1W1CHA1_9ZZZZ
MFSLDNTFANKEQKAFQETIGSSGRIQYLNTLVENSDTCMKIYTNNQNLEFNYYVSATLAKRFVIDRRHGLKALDSVEHNCSDGRYFALRGQTSDEPEWWKMERLIQHNIIKEVKNRVLMYFVPSGIKLKEDFYQLTEITDILLDRPQENTIEYSLDKYKLYDTVYVISGWAFLRGVQIAESSKYIVLKNKSFEYILASQANERKDVTRHFSAKDLSKSGFKIPIDKKDLAIGTYDMSLLLIDKHGQQHLISLNRKIEI